jgi:hypothetical protein
MDKRYARIVQAIEDTLHQMSELGPKPRREAESSSAYSFRVENWYKHKQRFVLFAIRCLKGWDKPKAFEYLKEMRKITREL